MVKNAEVIDMALNENNDRKEIKEKVIDLCKNNDYFISKFSSLVMK